MADALRTFGRKLPHAFRPFEEFLPSNRAFPPCLQSRKISFREDENVLMHITQGRVAGRLPASPCGGRTRARRLVPDDLSPHLIPEVVHILNDVRVKWNVRFASEVGNVDARSAAVDENTKSLGKHTLEHRAIFIQCQILVVLFRHVVGWRSDHEVHAVVGQFIHPLAALQQDGVQRCKGDNILDLPIRSGAVTPQSVIQPAFVKLRGIVSDAARRTERAGCRGLAIVSSFRFHGVRPVVGDETRRLSRAVTVVRYRTLVKSRYNRSGEASESNVTLTV